MVRTFVSLKTPKFRYWIYGQSIAVFGNWMQMTAQGFLIFDLTHSAFYLGATAFLGGISSWFFTLYAGVVADHLPRRIILLTTQSISMILSIVMSILTFTNIVQPWHILFLTLLLGITNAFESPARQAFVRDLVANEHMSNAISLNSTVFNLGTTLGPALSGITYLSFGPSWCFTLNAFSFIPLICILLFMDDVQTPPGNVIKNPRERIREGVGYSINHHLVRPIIAVVIVASTFGFSVFTLLPAWAVKVLHGGAGTNGWLQSARGIGALAGAIAMASVDSNFRKGRLLCISAVAFPFLLLGFALSNNLFTSLLFISLNGICFVIVYNSANTLLQYQVHDEIRGRVMSIYMLAFMGTTPFGSLAAGYISQTFSERSAIIFCSVIALILIIPIVLLSPRLQKH